MKRALNGWLGFALSGGGYLFGAFTAADGSVPSLGLAAMVWETCGRAYT